MTLQTGIRRYFTVAEWKKGWAIKLSYVLLQQADILLTNFAMSAGLSELNPVIRGLLHAPVQLLLIKLVIPLIIAWLVPFKLLLPAMALLIVVIALDAAQLSLLF